MSVSDSECQLPFMFFNCHFICILHNIFRISTYFPSVNNHFQRVRTENRIIFTKIPPKIVGCCFIAVKIKHFDVTCHEGFGLNPSHQEFTLNSSIPSQLNVWGILCYSYTKLNAKVQLRVWYCDLFWLFKQDLFL